MMLAFFWMLTVWERIFVCQDSTRAICFFLSPICQLVLSLRSSKTSCPVSSRPSQWGNTTGVRRNFWCFVANTWKHAQTNRCSTGDSLSQQAFYSCFCKDLKLSGGIPIQNLVYEGVMITVTGPTEGIFSDQVTLFSKPSQPAVGGSAT